MEPVLSRKAGGIDLSASTRKPSGVAVIHGNLVEVRSAWSDKEIIETVLAAQIVAIDSPLGLPSSPKPWRDIDKAILAMGYRLLPPVWRSMQKLVVRAKRIAQILQHYGVKVIETHPRSALLNSNCSFNELLARTGIVFERGAASLSRDEKDAVIAALVAAYYSAGGAICIVRIDGEICLLPKICT